MNASEAALLLGMAAARDRRTIGDADVLAWAEDLDDIRFETAQAALRRHYRESTDWLMPAHVRRLAAEIERDNARQAITAARDAEECEHLVPGGQRLHPVTQLPICPLCRRAAVAVPDAA